MISYLSDLLPNCLNKILIPQIIKIVTDKIISNHNNQCFLRSVLIRRLINV